MSGASRLGRALDWASRSFDTTPVFCDSVVDRINGDNVDCIFWPGAGTMTAGTIRLTGRQVYAFVEDRLDGTGPCRVQEHLTFDKLAGTAVLPNARIFLTELPDGGAKLTANGNLSRKHVETLIERLRWDGIDTAELRSYFKAINEHDFVPAMYLHAVLRLAGLVRHERGVLKLTKKGRALVPEGQAGRLQALLFRTTFTRYNPAYLDRFNMPEVFTPQISLILYLIGQICTDWRPADALVRSVAFPTEELTEPKYPGLPPAAFETRVLRYLCWFGLMEKKRPAANDDWRQPRYYRKTSLYDRMLRFPELR